MVVTLFGKQFGWLGSKNQKQEIRTSDNVIELPLAYQLKQFNTAPSVAVLLHAFYVDQIDEFRQALQNIPFKFMLFVSTDTEQKKRVIEQKLSGRQEGAFEIRTFPNIGRDIAPKFVGFRDVHNQYEFVLHIHTKKSPHDRNLIGWRPFLIHSLLGSREIVQSIFEMFLGCPRLGIVAPRNFASVRRHMVWGPSFNECAKLAARMSITIEKNSPLDFAAGSMFWARSSALQPLLNLGLSFDDFARGKSHIDGEIHHAIERLTFFSCERAGYSWCHAGPATAPMAFEKFHSIADVSDLHGVLESNALLSTRPLPS
jgi:lipopolysaccharide biosynthesis protein